MSSAVDKAERVVNNKKIYESAFGVFERHLSIGVEVLMDGPHSLPALKRKEKNNRRPLPRVPKIKRLAIWKTTRKDLSCF